MASNGGPVLVVDGDGRARATTIRALERGGYDTVDVARGEDALAVVRDNGVALVLLEVTLPDMTGWEVLREVRDMRGDVMPILFLSSTRRTADRIAGLLLGADDFIRKPFEPAELVARVRRFVVRNGSTASEPVNGVMAEELRLTQREREILALLAIGRRQKEIAGELTISPKTVATHIQSLLKKLGVHSRAELVARAWALKLV